MEGERLFRNSPTPKWVTFRVEITEFGGVAVAERGTRWLEGLGLGQYAPAFSDNTVGIGDLRYLTDEDLTRLGLPLGPRRRLQAAVKALAESSKASIEQQAESQLDEEEAEEKRDAERRQLTVLFCDLVGSTQLSGRLDPEDMAEVIRAYQGEVARQVTHYEGHVAKFMGDGVLAYFGWPRAHEDDAERAVRAALAVTEAVARLRTSSNEPLAARVGIATGIVVVGNMSGQSGTDKDAVVGETPNLAARLQSVAPPGQRCGQSRDHPPPGPTIRTRKSRQPEPKRVPRARTHLASARRKPCREPVRRHARRRSYAARRTRARNRCAARSLAGREKR